MEANGKKDLDPRKEPDKIDVPDLALTMQAMSIADPGLGTVQSTGLPQKDDLDFSFCLILKVACTGGTPRSISQQALEQAMERAWKEKFYAISQVSNTVFVAHFRTQEDMISVYTRQPWVANSENLLVDWFDLNIDANSSSDYKFDYILATVRAYGVPRNRRSVELLKSIMNQVGEVSDFHILQNTNLFAKQDYIWGTVRLTVSKPVKDKIMVVYPDNTSGIAYLHYEKIKRICLFCGIMFHNAQNCTTRNFLISERQKHRQSGIDIPAQRFGQWIIDDKLIPQEAIIQARMGGQGSNQRGNAILNKLQRLFAEDPKGKGKLLENTSEQREKATFNSTSQNRALNIGQQIKTALIESSGQGMTLNTIADVVEQNIQNASSSHGQANAKLIMSAHERLEKRNEGEVFHNKDDAANNPSTLPHMENAKGNEKAFLIPTSETLPQRNPSKRSAPSTESLNQPNSKKPMSSQGDHLNFQTLQPEAPFPVQRQAPSILQCDMKAPSPFFPGLTLAANTPPQSFYSSTEIAETGTGILGAGPSFRENTNIDATVQEINTEHKTRRRPTGWDVDDTAHQGRPTQRPQGSTKYKPGAATWKRHANLNSQGKGRKAVSAHVSPCRSDASSAIASTFEHGPWPLHMPTNTASQGTQGPKLGAFSPPHMTRDCYVTSDTYLGPTGRTYPTSLNIQQNQVAQNQGQEVATIEALNKGAEAPAQEAPRAP